MSPRPAPSTPDDGSRSTEGSKSRAREALTRDVILDAAIELMDAQGVQHLTMRRLGSQLDVEAMSLYYHVNGREDLLEGVVDRLVDQIRVEPGGQLEPSDGWQAYLQWLAHGVRELALAHPSIFPLIATRHPAAPWLRPPLRSLRIVEEFLNALIDRGFTPSQAVQAYRAFSSFLLGHLLLEVATLGAETSPVEEPLDEGAAALGGDDQELALENYPTITSLRSQLSEDHTEIEFELALEALLDRMDLDLSQ